MVDTTYQTQFVREAPEIEAYKLGMLQEAQNLYNQGVALPATEAAGHQAQNFKLLTLPSRA